MELSNVEVNAHYVLRIEHLVHDVASWKKVFDSDPGDRRGNGVIQYRISHLTSNQNYLIIDLEFEHLIALEKFHNILRKLWVQADGKIIEGVKSYSMKTIEHT